MAGYTLTGLDPKFWQSVKILAAKRDLTVKALICHLLQQDIEHVNRKAQEASVTASERQPAQKRPSGKGVVAYPKIKG